MYPNMRAAITPLFKDITIGRMATTILDGETTQVATNSPTQGAVVPLKYSDLIIKPESQRAWKWKALFTYSDFKLEEEEIITYNGIKYKVKSVLDMSEFGIMSYHLVEDFQ